MTPRTKGLRVPLPFRGEQGLRVPLSKNKKAKKPYLELL